MAQLALKRELDEQLRRKKKTREESLKQEREGGVVMANTFEKEMDRAAEEKEIKRKLEKELVAANIQLAIQKQEQCLLQQYKLVSQRSD